METCTSVTNNNGDWCNESTGDFEASSISLILISLAIISAYDVTV